MNKNDLLEMVSNLEVQLNEAEDKITMSTYLKVCKSVYLSTYFRLILVRKQRLEIIGPSLQRME